MSRVGRAIEKGETQGFMKVVADAETKKILGAAILGTGGDEAIHGMLDIMNAGVTYDRAATGGADSSDGVRVDSDAAVRDEAGRLIATRRSLARVSGRRLCRLLHAV